MEMMQALLTAGANPMALGGSCLVAACLGRHIDAVRLLLDSGVPAEVGAKKLPYASPGVGV